MTEFVRTVVEWPLGLNLFLVFALSALVPLISVWLMRRKWPFPTFKENNELIGFTYAVYGLIYGVLLAFTIIIGWESFSATERIVMDEATTLSEIWRDSQALQPGTRDSIHKDLLAYTQSVIDDEWPAMAVTGQAAPQTQVIYEHLWSLTYDIQPETKIQEAYLIEVLARMNELSGDRRLRIMNSRSEVPTVLMLVLLIGAVPTVAYTLLFSNKHAWVQMVIMGNIMLIVLLGLLVMITLQYPFSGGVSIQPDAFHDLLDSFHQRAATAALL